jgi:hypothetical protein
VRTVTIISELCTILTTTTIHLLHRGTGRGGSDSEGEEPDANPLRLNPAQARAEAMQAVVAIAIQRGDSEGVMRSV